MTEKQPAPTKDASVERALAVLEPQDGNALVPGTPWTRSQALTLVHTVAPGLTPDEFKLFAYRCQFAGLDPFLGQIHAVKRNDGEGSKRLCIQTGIDGFRLIAHRTKECAGIEDPQFTYAPTDQVQKQPLSATCTVYRLVQGQRCAFTATVRWGEYCPAGKQGFMWQNKPHVMLGKCAEAQALRKAFPAEMSGLYAEEELAQGEPADERASGAPSRGTQDLNAQLRQRRSNDQVADEVVHRARNGNSGPQATPPPEPPADQEPPTPDSELIRRQALAMSPEEIEAAILHLEQEHGLSDPERMTARLERAGRSDLAECQQEGLVNYYTHLRLLPVQADMLQP